MRINPWTSLLVHGIPLLFPDVSPEPTVEVAPPVVEEDPNVPRLPPNVERAKGGYLIGGRFVRGYKNSRRPPWIWPEIWKMMHVAARDKEAAEWEVLRGRLEAAEAAAQQAIPGASSSSSSSHGSPPPRVRSVTPPKPHGYSGGGGRVV